MASDTVTPHRVPTMATAFVGNVRGLAAMSPDATGAAATGVIALIGWAFGAANAELIILLLLAMLLDLMVGAARAVVDPLDEFSPRALLGGLFGKMFRLLIIPAAAIIDRAIIASGVPLPETYGELFPVVKMVCLALIYAEITSALNHFRAGGAAPGAIAVIMRHMDRTKLGHEPPMKRDYDKAAAIEEAEAEEEQRRRGT